MEGKSSIIGKITEKVFNKNEISIFFLQDNSFNPCSSLLKRKAAVSMEKEFTGSFPLKALMIVERPGWLS
jgi:hypothetical protein